MPEENHGECTIATPNANASPDIRSQDGGDEGLSAVPIQAKSQKDNPRTAELARGIKSGEKWLIGLGILTLAVNTSIAFIYIDQLKAMQRANELTQAALRSASQSSMDSSKQFQVQLRHFDASIGTQQIQIGKLDASISQASRLADATEKANWNVLENDRPWIGAYLQGANFEVGKKLPLSIIFMNSGRRPAKADLVVMHGNIYKTFPDPEKEYDYSGMKSRVVIVPNSTTQSTTSPDHEMTDLELQIVNSGSSTFYVFAKMEYHDVRTQKKHWIHVCYQYIPLSKVWAGGFQQCNQYNETDDDEHYLVTAP